MLAQTRLHTVHVDSCKLYNYIYCSVSENVEHFMEGFV